MGGFFGIASRDDCVHDLFYGTDYHSHLGTQRGGLAVKGPSGFTRIIHDISNSQFRSKFSEDIVRLHGATGIGVISDYEDQPLLIGSHLGLYAIVTVGVIKNLEELAALAFRKRTTHFSEMSGGEINPTELVATLINQESSYEAGIRKVHDLIQGSCSILLLTDGMIYAARDKFGRTPVIIGERDGAVAAASETCAFDNLGYRVKSYLGPGEIVRFTPDRVEQMQAAGDRMQICSFLWVYYGYPASCYEGINVEDTRNRCGARLAQYHDGEIDFVAGIPDSGTGHAIGYASAAGLPYRRPFVKYTPTWPRSFMPQNQERRDLVAKMKLIPIRELIDGKRLLFCEDSIVRGTQLKDTIRRLHDHGAREVHMRPACPPLMYGCKFLNFSRSKSEDELASRQAIKALGDEHPDFASYAAHGTDRYNAMVDKIRERLGLTTLRYQKLEDLVAAIGLPKEKLCTYCWDGAE
ncbi:MAG: amidophosphoribosyltransferase [Kiritimatiellae bacterium]|nr:amidophosphoribosyltransferase [Kiritimatiellia bacterium]